MENTHTHIHKYIHMCNICVRLDDFLVLFRSPHRSFWYRYWHRWKRQSRFYWKISQYRLGKNMLSIKYATCVQHCSWVIHLASFSRRILYRKTDGVNRRVTNGYGANIVVGLLHFKTRAPKQERNPPKKCCENAWRCNWAKYP